MKELTIQYIFGHVIELIQMIDFRSSFSPKLITDILTIKCSSKSLQIDLTPNMVKKIQNIIIPKISQFEIQQINDQSNEEQIKIILSNAFFRFQYDTSLLNNIGDLDIQNIQTINYLSLIVMYNYIAWILHIEDLNNITEVSPLIKALFFVTKSQYSEILMKITVSVISEFCLYDYEMNVFDLMPAIWSYAKIYQCYDLIIHVIHHISKDQNDPRFHQFMEELIKFIDNYLTDNAIIQILQQFNGYHTTFNINSLKYLIKISNIVNKSVLPIIIPFFAIAISDILKTLDQITIKKPKNILETDDYYQNTFLIIGEFEFPNIKTLPNGFNPSHSENIPKNIDLSTFFSTDLSKLFLQIATIIQNDDILISPLISSFFKAIDQNISAGKSEFNLSILIAFLYILNEINRNAIKTTSIKPEYAFKFFQPEIFDYSMTIFNNKENNNNFTDYYLKMNTLRSISLEFILDDDGITIENILLSHASNYPNFIAELFFRLSKMTTIFAHCITKNQKLIKTIINLSISYQHLEITIENQNKEPIQNARVAIFVTLAHLFSDDTMLSLFFNDSLFLNAFFAFLFEESIRPFILSMLTLFLSKINIPLPTDIPSIFYRVLNILNLNLPDHRYLLLLYDLIKSLNSGLTFRQMELVGFQETTKILCQSMVKINQSESDDDLSKQIFKEMLSFLILMSPFFEISALEMDALITCILSFKDEEFINSLYKMFISLLAGQMVTPNSTNFVIFQPQIFTLLIQVFLSTPKLKEILKFIYNVISFSPKNLQKCCEINLDLFIMKCLENAKMTGERSDDEVQGFLDIYNLLSISHSSTQSVLSYISLLCPIDSMHVSKYHLKFIESMDQIVIESSKLPRSTFPLNGRVMHVASSSFINRKVDFTKIEKGFSVAFWIFIEPTFECNRIFSFRIGDQIKIGIVYSNNVILIYQSENHITKTKPILEEIKLHTWTFCAFTFEITKKLIVIKYLFKQSTNEAITTNSITIDNFKSNVDMKKASLKLGGYCQLNSPSSLILNKTTTRSNSVDSSSSYLNESDDNMNNSLSRLGSFGLFELMNVNRLVEIARMSLQNSPNLQISPIVYVNDFSEFDETITNGFVDVLACQSGVNLLLPLFLQNDMKTFDDKPFHLSLETILSLLMHILTYSFEAQTNFFLSKGFNIIAQLLTDRWTPFFTIKTHLLLYQTLGSIQYEPLQQQLFDEVLTNFTFIQKLEPDLHYRIVKHWPPLFESFSSIAQNFSSFEDLVGILRLFYWYTPNQMQYIKYVDLRSDKLNVKGIRKILFSLLLSYAFESFKYSHFQCIIGHCLSFPELHQVSEMINFLIDVFNKTPNSIQFNVECEPLIALLSYFIRFPDEGIRIDVLNFFITTHKVKKISDEFFQLQVDSILSFMSEISMSRALFDFLIENLENEPLLLNLCCYLAIHFNDASFMHKKRVTFHVSKFWAVLPLYLAIYIDQSATDFIFKMGKNELCDIFTQYDIFFERSKSFESVFIEKLLEFNQKDLNINDTLEVCKRIILFTTSNEEATISSNCFSLFNDQINSEKAEKLNEETKHQNNFNFDFFKRAINNPQLKFHLHFDQCENWSHSKLSVFCLSLFEHQFSQSFLPFDILLCSFLQATNFDGVYEHLNNLKLNEKDLSECESVLLPLLIYHSIRNNKKELNFLNIWMKTQFNPLLNSSKFDHLVRQMTPKSYIKKLSYFYKEYFNYKKKITDHCTYINSIHMAQYIVSSCKQMSQFLERQQFQNDLNIRSWRRLWSALSIERAPWHIESKEDINDSDRKVVFSRDICACFALAPVKMHKHFHSEMNELEIDNYEDAPHNSRFSKKRGILFDSICFLIFFEEIDDVKKRKKANFELYKSKIKLIMLDDFLRGKIFTIPLSSLKYVFRRANNGMHLFTEYGYSFHIEFNESEVQLNAMKLIFSNLMKSMDKSILLFQNADNKQFFKALSYLEQWKNGKMSNYEYILMLNHCSGRSFNDLNRYPIFPWILNNYSTDIDSLFSRGNIRDFNLNNSNKNLMPKVAVLTYLSKIEPYKFLSKELIQNKDQIDTEKNCQYKDCHSMDQVLEYAKENGIEFVPELYSMPEIIDSKSSTFSLPIWSNNSETEFIYRHRKILESPEITSSIHNWFNFVFGKNSENELFESPHPTCELFDRERRYPMLNNRLEISIGNFNFTCGIIEERETSLVFGFKLLCEDGKLVQTTINLRHLISSPNSKVCSNNNGNNNIESSSNYNSCSSESSAMIDHDDNEIICDYNNSESQNSSSKNSFNAYSSVKGNFHFSFPRISDGLDSISSSKEGHFSKKKKLAGSSSNLDSFADHFTGEVTRISSLDCMAKQIHFTKPQLTIMETPLNVGKSWNSSKSFTKQTTPTTTPSFVISSDGKFYVARGQTIAAIDLTLKKLHEVNVSGSTITTSPSNLASTIADVSSSASTSTASFTIMQSTSGDKQNLTFVAPNMVKLSKVPSKNSERSNSFNSEESPFIGHNLSSSNVTTSIGYHQRPRSISAAASFSSSTTTNKVTNSSSSSTFSISSENSMKPIISKSSMLNAIRCIAADGLWLAAGRDNASISIVCNLRSVATVQLYRSSVSACAVSQTFNVLACGTLDGALVIYTKNAGKIIKVVDISKCYNNSKIEKETFCEKREVTKRKRFNSLSSVGSVIPKKIIITPTWGFIVVFCNEIDLGVLKRFICIFTINGEFIRKVDISVDIDFWTCWSSYSGFDYIVYASESGHIYINEVFYMNNSTLLFNCRDRIVASYFSKQSSTLVLATSGGKLLFFPIVF